MIFLQRTCKPDRPYLTVIYIHRDINLHFCKSFVAREYMDRVLNLAMHHCIPIRK